MITFLILVLYWTSWCLALESVPFERQSASVSSIWTKIGEAESTSILDLRIVMSNPKNKEFEELALDIATPHSGQYRKHLKASDLASWTTIPPSNWETVETWLLVNGITDITRNHDILEARMSISQAQELLNTTYYAYIDNLGHIVCRAEEYFIPHNLVQFIEIVHPIVNFPHHAAKSKTGQNLVGQKENSVIEKETKILQKNEDANPCHGRYITPACVHYFYKVDYQPPLNTNVTVWNTFADAARINATDLQKYLELFNPPAAKAHARIANHRIGPVIKPVYIEGANEELLDAQMMIGNGFPVKASYTFLNGKAGAYQWGPGPQQKHRPSKLHHYEEFYVDFLHSLAHDDFVPAALTSSEFDYDLTVTRRYAQYICKLWSQLGARGVSVFFCSSDGGSGGLRTKHGARVLPIFTSGCPFVTSVGSTVYVNDTELAVTDDTWKYIHDKKQEFISGGGFSSIFERPRYQDESVKPYVSKENLADKFENVTMFNVKGRGYPDVAAFGTNLPYVNKGKAQYIGGTSASTPTVAALIGILNAYEESRGRPPLGFLNPWFYSNPDMFNDITKKGSNELCRAKRCRGLGYPVTKGWDAVTGLGSLRFNRLREALDQLALDGALG